jgi:hypothetical protein
MHIKRKFTWHDIGRARLWMLGWRKSPFGRTPPRGGQKRGYIFLNRYHNIQVKFNNDIDMEDL